MEKTDPTPVIDSPEIRTQENNEGEMTPNEETSPERKKERSMTVGSKSAHRPLFAITRHATPLTAQVIVKADENAQSKLKEEKKKEEHKHKLKHIDLLKKHRRHDKKFEKTKSTSNLTEFSNEIVILPQKQTFIEFIQIDLEKDVMRDTEIAFKAGSTVDIYDLDSEGWAFIGNDTIQIWTDLKEVITSEKYTTITSDGRYDYKKSFSKNSAVILDIKHKEEEKEEEKEKNENENDSNYTVKIHSEKYKEFEDWITNKRVPYSTLIDKGIAIQSDDTVQSEQHQQQQKGLWRAKNIAKINILLNTSTNAQQNDSQETRVLEPVSARNTSGRRKFTFTGEGVDLKRVMSSGSLIIEDVNKPEGESEPKDIDTKSKHHRKKSSMSSKHKHKKESGDELKHKKGGHHKHHHNKSSSNNTAKRKKSDAQKNVDVDVDVDVESGPVILNIDFKAHERKGDHEGVEKNKITITTDTITVVNADDNGDGGDKENKGGDKVVVSNEYDESVKNVEEIDKIEIKVDGEEGSEKKESEEKVEIKIDADEKPSEEKKEKKENLKENEKIEIKIDIEKKEEEKKDEKNVEILKEEDKKIESPKEEEKPKEEGEKKEGEEKVDIKIEVEENKKSDDEKPPVEEKNNDVPKEKDKLPEEKKEEEEKPKEDEKIEIKIDTEEKKDETPKEEDKKIEVPKEEEKPKEEEEEKAEVKLPEEEKEKIDIKIEVEEKKEPEVSKEGGEENKPQAEIEKSSDPNSLPPELPPPLDETKAETTEEPPNEKVQEAVKLFNEKPAKGLKLLQELGVVGTEAKEIAELLHARGKELGINEKTIGDFLGSDGCKSYLDAYLERLNFTHMDFDSALRRFLSVFHLPGEGQKIDRVMDSFGERFYEDTHDPFFANKDAVFTLAFSTIMLNTDHYNPSIKKKMTLKQFMNNLRGTNDSGNFDTAFIEVLFNQICCCPLMFPETAVYPMAYKRGWLLQELNVMNTKRRWFVLDIDGIRSFRSTSPKDAKHFYPLESLTFDIKFDKKRKFVLNALCDGNPEPVKLKLTADNAIVYNSWIEILTHLIKDNVPITNAVSPTSTSVSPIPSSSPSNGAHLLSPPISPTTATSSGGGGEAGYKMGSGSLSSRSASRSVSGSESGSSSSYSSSSDRSSQSSRSSRSSASSAASSRSSMSSASSTTTSTTGGCSSSNMSPATLGSTMGTPRSPLLQEKTLPPSNSRKRALSNAKNNNTNKNNSNEDDNSFHRVTKSRSRSRSVSVNEEGSKPKSRSRFSSVSSTESPLKSNEIGIKITLTSEIEKKDEHNTETPKEDENIKNNEMIDLEEGMFFSLDENGTKKLAKVYTFFVVIFNSTLSKIYTIKKDDHKSGLIAHVSQTKNASTVRGDDVVQRIKHEIYTFIGCDTQEDAKSVHGTFSLIYSSPSTSPIFGYVLETEEIPFAQKDAERGWTPYAEVLDNSDLWMVPLTRRNASKVKTWAEKTAKKQK